MLHAIVQEVGKSLPHCPALRGYGIVYREGELNFCPGCGRSNWFVGRLLAECAYCNTAVPLSDVHIQGTGGHSRNRRQFIPSALAA